MKKIIGGILLLVVAFNFNKITSFVTSLKPILIKQFKITENITCDFYECQVLNADKKRFDVSNLYDGQIQLTNEKLIPVSAPKIELGDIKEKVRSIFSF